MTRFLDGPAAGKILMLKTAPGFLRAVVSCGKWDALDQPDDVPQLDETVCVYVLNAKPGHCHINARGKGGKRTGGFYAIAEYKLCPEQPDEQTGRDRAKFSAWCEARTHLVKAELLP